MAGLLTRIAAFILALHLAIITIELGYGETAVRDFGLTFATLSIALGGPDQWSLDQKLWNHQKR